MQKQINAGLVCFRNQDGNTVWTEVSEDLGGAWQGVWQSLGWNTGCLNGSVGPAGQDI